MPARMAKKSSLKLYIERLVALSQCMSGGKR